MWKMNSVMQFNYKGKCKEAGEKGKELYYGVLFRIDNFRANKSFS